MEIYRNKATEVKVRAPDLNALYTVTVKSAGGETVIPSLTAVTDPVIDTAITIPIEYQHTLYDGVITLEITMNGQHTFKEYVDVVTPLFRHEDVPSNYPKEDVPELERLVRKVVEARTGQSFGVHKKTIIADNSVGTLALDAPLIMLTSVHPIYAPLTTTLTPPKESYEVASDRYSVAINWDYYDVKTDSMWILDRKCPKSFVIQGNFGYERVPQDVKEAALLIAGVWGCEQAVWRDRYIQTMRSSDWSVQYNNGAYESTGSATADQLLAKYTRRYMPEVF